VTKVSTEIARIYARESEDDKDKIATSIPNQIKTWMNNKEKILGTLDSNKPFYEAQGEKSWLPIKERKILSQALTDGLNGEYQILLITHWDRLARGRNLQTIIFMFEQAGIKIIPWSGSTDEMSVEVEGFVSGLYVKKFRDKAIEMQEERIKQGLPLSSPPIGYRYGTNRIRKGRKMITSSDGQWHIHKEEAKIVQEIYRRTIQKQNNREICNEFNIKKTTYYYMIKNMSYIGILKIKRKIRDPDGKIHNTKETIYKGVHKPIIDLETWKKMNGEPPVIN
jgi:DNA invertase Pin-like site-specific DNA recombinase